MTPNFAWPRIPSFGTIYAMVLASASLTPAGAASIIPPVDPAKAAAAAVASPQFSYADHADLALAAPVVVGVQIAKSERLKGDLAPGLAADHARFLITATVQMLLKGADGVPGTINYIVDMPLDTKGKAPTLKKSRMLLFAEKVAGRPLELRLNSPYSQLNWTQPTEERLRAILTEATAATAPPRVTGVGNAFHVPGAIPGESESQIFLTTANGRPISLSILRRPGEQPQWAVALGEMVDDSAKTPKRDTLLWYRLACFLPGSLPAKSVAALSSDDADAVRADYRLVIQQLGSCGRTIKRG